MARTALVYYGDTFAGHLRETDEGYSFAYDPVYLSSGSAKPVSLTLPLRQETYISKTLFSFFDGLIPEGWLLSIAEQYWKIRHNDRFELLINLCEDAIGAVSIMPGKEEENG